MISFVAYLPLKMLHWVLIEHDQGSSAVIVKPPLNAIIRSHMIHNWTLDQYCFGFFIKKKNTGRMWSKVDDEHENNENKNGKQDLSSLPHESGLIGRGNVIVGCFPMVIYATPHDWWNGSRTIKWFTSCVHCVPVTRQARFVNKAICHKHLSEARSCKRDEVCFVVLSTYVRFCTSSNSLSIQISFEELSKWTK